MRVPTCTAPWVHFTLGLVLCCAQSASAAEPDAKLVGFEFFESKIRPVLVNQCYECHSVDAIKSGKLKGGLLLDTREAIRRGGESGPAVVPSNVDESLLVSAVKYESFEMPPRGRLDEKVIGDFVRWIELGAPDPREETAASEIPAADRQTIDWDEARSFWSFQTPRRHAPPTVSRADWSRTAIDPFVLARLEKAGLTPSAKANDNVWLRRVTFDLIGLPPTMVELIEFEHDASPRARERVVERLLASPQFGERWARMWLDVARYAEDQAHIVGKDDSLFYPNAYRYRDWVIDAFNADMPYDEFVRRQLAADLIDPADLESHVALGFIGLGPKYYSRGSPAVMADENDDRVDTVSRGLLGLTVACARCHDHKFDPIATEDYYALAGVFASTEMFNRPLTADVELGKNGHAKSPSDALHIVRDVKPVDLNVAIRGDVTSRGPVVPRRFVRVLCASEPTLFEQGSGRLELAKEITRPDNPLFARVFVNRVWGEFFGRPLVGTPSNFGSMGEPPTHPDLLDDLAARFVESGWSIKWLMRELALSATYAQASHAVGPGVSVDPANEWLWRMNRRRLSVEAFRDATLAVAGRLDSRVGGESIDPRSGDETRRTVYSRVSRLDLDAMLATFDFPDPNATADRRALTTTPLQKLFVLNSEFMVRQSDALAERLMATSADDARRIDHAYRLLYARRATRRERELGMAFLAGDPATSADRWRQYAQVLLAANEFLMLD